MVGVIIIINTISEALSSRGISSITRSLCSTSVNSITGGVLALLSRRGVGDFQRNISQTPTAHPFLDRLKRIVTRKPITYHIADTS